MSRQPDGAYVMTGFVLLTMFVAARVFVSAHTWLFRGFAIAWLLLGVLVLCLRWLPGRSPGPD